MLWEDRGKNESRADGVMAALLLSYWVMQNNVRLGRTDFYLLRRWGIPSHPVCLQRQCRELCRVPDRLFQGHMCSRRDHRYIFAFCNSFFIRFLWTYYLQYLYFYALEEKIRGNQAAGIFPSGLFFKKEGTGRLLGHIRRHG